MFMTTEKTVRTCIKKHSTPEIPNDVITEAIKAVTERNMSLYGTSSLYGTTHRALYFRVEKSKGIEDVSNAGMIYSSNYSSQ
jgi:hypothetical protein